MLALVTCRPTRGLDTDLPPGHAVRNGPIPAGPVEFSGDLMAADVTRSHVATVAEAALGERAVCELPEIEAAGIGLAPTSHGPVLVEPDATDPSLFPHHDDETAARAAAVFRSLVP